MSFKTTAVLLVLVLFVGAYFFLFERHPTTLKQADQDLIERSDEEGQPIGELAWLGDAVGSVTVVKPGQDAVVITNESGQWAQAEPVRFPLDRAAIEGLIQDAAGLRYVERFTPGTEGMPTLEDADLQRVWVELTFEEAGGSGRTATIKLGPTTVGGRGYVRLGEREDVYVVNDDLHTRTVAARVSQWRRKSFDVPTEGQARKVALAYDGKTIATAKIDGSWQLESPYSGRVDAEAVARLLGGLRAVTVDEFGVDLPDSLSPYGLDSPQVAVTVWSSTFSGDRESPSSQPAGGGVGDGGLSQVSALTQQTLVMGGFTGLGEDAVYATWSQDGQYGDVVFAVAAEAVEPLRRTVDQMRDPRVITTAAGDVRQLALDRAEGQDINLVRSVDGWTFGDPKPPYDADHGAASQWVDSLVGIGAQSYRPDYQPVGGPLMTVSIGVLGSTDETVRVYHGDTPETLIAVRNDETVGYVVSTEQLGGMFLPAIFLRQRTVLDLSSADVVRVSLSRPDGAVYTFERPVSGRGQSQPVGDERDGVDDGSGQTPTERPADPPGRGDESSWVLVGHDHFEQADWRDLWALLRVLRAEGWAVGSQTTSAAEAGPVTWVSLERSDGTVHTLLVHTELRRAKLDAQEDWFEISDALAGLVDREFRYRTVLPLGVEQIASVEFSNPEGSVRLERDRSGAYVSGSGQAVDPEMAAEVFETLAGLRVERFTQPLHVPLPVTTVTVTSATGQEYRLVLPRLSGHETTATLGQQWFELDAKAIAVLLAPLGSSSTSDGRTPAGEGASLPEGGGG